MTANHTPGPRVGVVSGHTIGRLHVGEFRPLIVYDEKGRAVCNAMVYQGDFKPHEKKENARRFAACWNACEGVETTLLEQHHAPFSELRRERDELLNALRMIEHATAPTPNDGGHHEAAHDIARAAIAKATGAA